MATYSLHRALTTKPNSLLLHSSKLSFFSTNTSPSPSPSPSPFSSFRAAQSTIVTESNPNKIADVLLSQSSFSAFTRYRPIYPYAIRKLARASRCDLVARIVEDHLATKKNISEGFVIRFIMLYSEAGMVDHALRLFYEFMPQFHSSEKPKLFCAILTALLNNSNFEKFHEVFDDVVESSSVSPGVKVYNLKLRAQCEEGNVELAEKLLVGKMEKEFGVSPEIIHSYNVMLGAYLKRKDWRKFDEMVKDVLSKGLEGNVTTYKHRIVRLCKEKESAGAKELLDEMMAKGITPNAACYNWIIYGFCRVGDLELAKLVLEKMISDGSVAPSSLTYYTLFRHMVQEGEFVAALDTCKMIFKRKWVPPFEAMEGLVKGLVEMSNRKDAIKMVKKMKKRLRGPALVSWGKVEAALPL
ncbi:pentatricopeptide repeat-containing protein At1g61870, mitochondrial [Beta vulgaris subsp. vulgaris]|uniref:pentatricopeptide repeat-containing protein At1g61870, mitochondrial n=1 Tax=Beta vulgaris subsp. vulgaris TaxID=3555 RepID=UPI002548B73B|nr:pentatricopeptide repeat-containing protein At1g61870, mitochondrial [Beta vulgaris subsp. vulgaris]